MSERSDKLRKQINKVTTTHLEAQERSVNAEELLARLEDRDQRRELRRRAVGPLPGRR